jgi:DNA-binding transcriptional MerR regulator
MRVSELSRASGVPLPTIKYYLREGLLHRGETTSPNQARYDESHLRRLRLIRALLEIGAMPVATVRNVLDAVDDPELPVHWMLGKATHPLTVPPAERDDDPAVAAALDEIDTLVDRAGWHVSRGAPARRAAASVLVRLRALGQDGFANKLDDYARAAEQLAEADLRQLATLSGRDEVAEAALVGTVLGDALVSALRRMAQESFSAKQFPQPVSGEPPCAPPDGTGV